MTHHLPLTPGDYTTASGFTPRIVRIGKYGKFAFGANGEKWHVETGKHYRDAAHDITGRAEPAPAHDSVTAEGMALVRDRVAKDMAGRTFTPMIEAAPIEAQLEHWRQEVGKLHSQVDHLTAERDAAVAANAALGRELNRVKYGEPDFAWAIHQDKMADLDAANAALMVRLEEARGDSIGLRDQIAKLLGLIDDYPGNEMMHHGGQTPDFYVEAAFWSCYGYGPNDSRAYLAGKP